MPDVNEKLLETIELSPIATVVSNPRRTDNPIEVANAAFCDHGLFRELRRRPELPLPGRRGNRTMGHRPDPRCDRLAAASAGGYSQLSPRRHAVSQRSPGHAPVRRGWRPGLVSRLAGRARVGFTGSV